MRVPAEIFRAYDIRGLLERDLGPDVAFHLGRAIGTTVRRRGGSRLVVGMDSRRSGPMLLNRLIDGLLASGCHAVRIGTTPTPVGYWAIEDLGADGGVHVTGSHNPAEYNGFKLTLFSESLHGPAIAALRRLIEQEDYEDGQAAVSDVDVLDRYVDELARNLRPATTRLKVVVDAGNGTAGTTAVPLYRRLGHEVVPLYCEPLGEFPHHHPDPSHEANLEALKTLVAAQEADLGLAFDGDADRLAVIDRDGSVVWGDRLTVLFARALLAEVPGAVILGEVKCTRNLFEDIAARGGRPVMWKAGHSFIKTKMKEEGGLLAGEMSGHIFFKHRYYGFDDAVYAGGRLLEILSSAPGSIAEHLSDLPTTVATPEIQLPCPEAHKFALVRRLTERFRRCQHEADYRVCDIDGVRVEWEDGWGLVRCSNTQPLLILRGEAETKERLDQICSCLRGELASAQMEMG